MTSGYLRLLRRYFGVEDAEPIRESSKPASQKDDGARLQKLAELMVDRPNLVEEAEEDSGGPDYKRLLAILSGRMVGRGPL